MAGRSIPTVLGFEATYEYRKRQKKVRLNGNELENLMKESAALELAKETNELFRRGSGLLRGNRVQRKPIITVSREISRNNRTTFTGYQLRGGEINAVGAKMKSTSPEVKQKYDNIAAMYFRIVARTPYDEDYVYTTAAPERQKSHYYRTNPKTGKRIAMGYVSTYTHMHKADDVVCRDTWKLTLKNEDGSTAEFLPADFKVSFENVTNKTAYLSISKMLREMNCGSDGPKDFYDADIRNDNPYVDVLEYGRYEHEDSREMHKGPKRYHGIKGAYSVQAPRGMVGITVTEFNEAEQAASSENRQVAVSDVGFTLELPFEPDEIMKSAMANIKEFVNEKDILEAFNKGLKHLPVNTKNIERIRAYYRKEAQDRLKKEDDAAFERLKREVEEEERKERLELEKEANEKRNHKNSLRRLNYAPKRKTPLKINIETPMAKATIKPIKSPVNLIDSYLRKSETEIIYGKIKLKFEDDVGIYDCKIEKRKIYADFFGKYVPIEEFYNLFTGRNLTEKKLEKLFNTFIRVGL